MAKKTLKKTYIATNGYDHTKYSKKFKDKSGADIIHTVPGQAVSVKEILERHATGRPDATV